MRISTFSDPGVTSVRFGNEILLLEPEPAASRAASRDARAASREELHVVVQNGRLFQEHHPEVPVLHDRGRFLLVRLDPAEAARITEETCFGIMPLGDDQVVFDEPPAVAARAAAPAFIQPLVDVPQRATIEPNLQALVEFGTRHSTTDGFAKAARFVEKQLKDLGYTTRTQTIRVNGKNSRNVIAEKAGGGTGRKVVIVCAHLDSINLQAASTTVPAPGADDDGSGSAGVLEIARAFRSHSGVNDLRLILFGGEEEGLFGSKHYVAKLSATERHRIAAVVNMDMIGSLNSASRSVLLEGSPISQSLIDKLRESAQAYTSLTVQTSLNPFASDHVPFINAAIPAVLTIEGADNANSRIHSERDTLASIDYDLLVEILRMNIGCIAAEVG